MNKLVLSFLVSTLVLSSVFAQSRKTEIQNQQRQSGGQRGGVRGFPQFPLMTALDTDKDGKISAEEMENAAKNLQKLDKNKDGKLSSEEIGWPPSFGGGNNRRGMGGFGGRGFPGFGGRASGPPKRPTFQELDSRSKDKKPSRSNS